MLTRLFIYSALTLCDQSRKVKCSKFVVVVQVRSWTYTDGSTLYRTQWDKANYSRLRTTMFHEEVENREVLARASQHFVIEHLVRKGSVRVGILQ